MADTMKKNYKISGSGTLVINGDEITVLCGDAGEFNLARVLAELDGCDVKFSFSHDEEYGESVDVDTETGEVI